MGSIIFFWMRAATGRHGLWNLCSIKAKTTEKEENSALLLCCSLSLPANSCARVRSLETGTAFIVFLSPEEGAPEMVSATTDDLQKRKKDIDTGENIRCL